MIADFAAQGIADRGFLTSADLKRIALVKNGGKLSMKTKSALASNTEAAVHHFTRMAFSESDPEFAVRILLGLDGVRLPTASCILAWTLPHKWPVIDVRSWRSVAKLSRDQLEKSPIGGLKVKHWNTHNNIVQLVASQTNQSPQKIDVWLYAYDKKSRI